MVDFEVANARLQDLLDRVGSPRSVSADEPLYCGLDVGTAFIVLAVVDAAGEPVACAYRFASVVKDGMVVDYMGAVDIARELKEELEHQLGRELEPCAVALPPGTEGLDGGVVKNVAEGAGLDVVAVFDEPTAANLLIGARDGAVVDIGGGTTGISVIQNGRVEYYARIGKEIPEGTLIARDGSPVTGDAGEALKMIRSGQAALTTLGGIGEALGGYKGYG